MYAFVLIALINVYFIVYTEIIHNALFQFFIQLKGGVKGELRSPYISDVINDPLYVSIPVWSRFTVISV